MPGDSIDALIQEGMRARRDGDPEAARAAFAKAEAESRRANDWPGQALALAGLAQIARDEDDFEESLRCYRATAVIWREQSNPGRLAHSIRHEADVLFELGRAAEAEPLYVEALALYRTSRTTAPLDLANAIRGYAILTQAKGASEEAIGLWREARDLYRSVGVEAGAAESARRLAMLESG